MNTSQDPADDAAFSADKEHSFEFNIRTEEIYFADQSNGYYCVCFVDMVNSTEVTARIADGNKIKKVL